MDTYYVINDSTLKCFADATRSLTGENKTYTTSEMISTLSESTGLNFSIVSYPTEEALLNATPNENVIGVVTDVDIPEWCFATENPYIHTTEELCTDVGAKAACRLDPSGNEVSDTNYKYVTDKIALPDNVLNIIVTSGNTLTSTTRHAFYDADGELISTVYRNARTTSYKVPHGAKSVRISVRSDDPGSFKATYINADTKEGTLCILNDSFSNANFNILKKNGIQADPIKAEQYVNGVFTDVIAKTYTDAEWKPMCPDLVLYDRGTKYATLTKSGKGSMTENSDHLLLKTEATAEAIFDVTVNEQIDLAPYKTLSMEYADYSSGWTCTSQILNGSTIEARANAFSTLVSGMATVDISEITGKRTLRIRLYTSAATARSVKILSWKLHAT